MEERQSWASEKVRVFIPPIPEKTTLRAIAWYADIRGYGAVPSYEKIAFDTGQNKRTVRRHVKKLVELGHLVTWCDVQQRVRSNNFFVPIAAETIEELEARTGISRNQLKLMLVQRDRGVTALAPAGLTCPSPEDTMALPQGHSVPLSMNSQNLNKDSGAVFSLRKKAERERARMEIINRERAAEAAKETFGQIAPKTRQLIEDTLQALTPPPDMASAELVEPEPIKTPFTRQEWLESLERSKQELRAIGANV